MKALETPAGCRLCSGDICLGLSGNEGMAGDVPVDLSKKEWLLLAYFMENPVTDSHKGTASGCRFGGRMVNFVDDNTKKPVNIKQAAREAWRGFHSKMSGDGVSMDKIP